MLYLKQFVTLNPFLQIVNLKKNLIDPIIPSITMTYTVHSKVQKLITYTLYSAEITLTLNIKLHYSLLPVPHSAKNECKSQ